MCDLDRVFRYSRPNIGINTILSSYIDSIISLQDISPVLSSIFFIIFIFIFPAFNHIMSFAKKVCYLVSQFISSMLLLKTLKIFSVADLIFLFPTLLACPSTVNQKAFPHTRLYILVIGCVGTTGCE